MVGSINQAYAAYNRAGNMNSITQGINNNDRVGAVRDAVSVGKLPNLGNIGSIGNMAGSISSTSAVTTPQSAFVKMVTDAMRKTSVTGYNSEAVSAKALNKEADYHELVVAINNAELSLQTVVAVRDRIVKAYNDIIAMPI